MISLLAGLLPKALDIVDSVIPDKDAAQKAKLEIEAKVMDAANQAHLAQLEINKAEAQSGSIFIGGWRPFVGWTCGLGMFYHFIGQPCAIFVMAYLGVETPPLPEFDMSQLMTILLGMLCLGGMRSWEKTKGVASR